MEEIFWHVVDTWAQIASYPGSLGDSLHDDDHVRTKREGFISAQRSSKHVGILHKVNPDDFVDIRRGSFYQYGPSYIPYFSTFGDLWNVLSEC
jgi:hypothetical protein